MRLAIICTVIIASFASPTWGQITKKGIIIQESVSISPFTIERYTPTIDDIILAERIIKSDSIFKTQKPNLLSYHCYYKQYAGFYNDKGIKYLVVNYTTDKEIWVNAGSQRWINIFDGGKHFWQATIDLDNAKIIKIGINGP